MNLNSSAGDLCRTAIEARQRLRIESHRLPGGARIIDFGVAATGGIEAGLMLARICMAGQANIAIVPADREVWNGPQVQVTTDHPVEACMASQYAGWPIQGEKFYAMGSGPMRAKRGREAVLEQLGLKDQSHEAVGVLECDQLPDEKICRGIAEECHVPCDALTLCVAPTRSLAGTIQIVARSIETSLHKLFELGFDLASILAGYGSAPMPPPARSFADGIGRTNDAILYGGKVELWVDTDDSIIESIGSRVPSSNARDWGRPFSEIFRDYEFDFYRVDPGLFSPAMVTFHNLRSGKSHGYGSLRPDVLSRSFASSSVD
jgi:methenyltetrahydromethanopterin cyclohydrolase